MVEKALEDEQWDLNQLDLVTKVDLAAAVEFSWETAHNNIEAVRPGMPVFQLSAKTGEGLENFLKFLAQHIERKEMTSLPLQT